MSDTMRLVLLRHGESVWNKENLFTGWTDVDLSDKGREEARAAGRLMRDEGLDFDVCYTSFLKRAIHTLNLALEEMDREWLPVVKAWTRRSSRGPSTHSTSRWRRWIGSGCPSSRPGS